MSERNRTEINRIFDAHPSLKELFRDSNGVIWTTLEAAQHQSKGGNVEVIKKKEPKKPTTQ